MDSILDTLHAMRRQEEAGYAVPANFLNQQQQEQHDPAVSGAPLGPLNVDPECRSKMASWCYQVVDFCKFRRETVEIAMNFLDRYLTTPAGMAALVDRKAYQLAAMTSLYTAVKIHEPEAMDPKLVSNLSRGTYSPEQIETMEASLLAALQWKLNPPTALSFARLFLDLIPSDMLNEGIRQTAYEITKYQTELSVSEYEMVGVRSSTIALCSLMNSFESVNMDAKVLGQIGYVLSQAVGTDMHNDDQIFLVQNWLYEAVIRQPAAGITFANAAPDSRPAKFSRRSSFEVSPRSVSATTR